MSVCNHRYKTRINFEDPDNIIYENKCVHCGHYFTSPFYTKSEWYGTNEEYLQAQEKKNL